MAVIIAIVTAGATANIENSCRNAHIHLLMCRWKYAQRHVNSVCEYVFVCAESHFNERNFNYKFNRASHNLCKHFFISGTALANRHIHTYAHTCLNTFVYEITYTQKMLILSHIATRYIPPIFSGSSFAFHVFTSHVWRWRLCLMLMNG